MFLSLWVKGFKTLKNFLVARQKKVTRNCEISIIMENRINKCNMSISRVRRGKTHPLRNSAHGIFKC